MKKTIIILLAVLIAIFLIFTILIVQNSDKYEYMEGYCGLKYYVIKGHDDIHKKKCKYAADMLCNINSKCLKLIAHLKNKYIVNGSDLDKKRMTRTLIDEYDVDDLVEDDDEAFTIGKGKKIHICMRNKEVGFIDINTIMFVVLHELSHIVTKPQRNPHTANFWVNNIWIMTEAESIGIFRSINYRLNPVKYCNGITLNKTPMYDKVFQEYVKNEKKSGNENNIEDTSG